MPARGGCGRALAADQVGGGVGGYLFLVGIMSIWVLVVGVVIV